jgi:hypothetical protein
MLMVIVPEAGSSTQLHVGIGWTGKWAVLCAGETCSSRHTGRIAIDYAKDRIHCNALYPGFVKSATIDSLIPTDEYEKGRGE